MRCPSLQLTVVLGAFALGACTSNKANPVLPSTGNPNGWVASGTYDAQADVTTTDSLTDGYADLSVGDSAPGSCNLLTQQGCATNEACYPTSDVGKCQQRGSVGVLGSCALDQLVCDRGLACVPLDMGDTCVQICDADHPQAICGPRVTCHRKWVGGTIGYCEPAA
jgi:hypothetical protein